MYLELYSVTPPSAIEVHAGYFRYMTLTINDKVFGSYRSRSKHSSIVLAKLNNDIRPARINFFLKHDVIVKGESIPHVLASLSWFQHHENEHDFGKPVTVWEHDICCDPCVFGFIPIQLILNRTVSLVDQLNEYSGNVLFVSPYDI